MVTFRNLTARWPSTKLTSTPVQLFGIRYDHTPPLLPPPPLPSLFPCLDPHILLSSSSSSRAPLVSSDFFFLLPVSSSLFLCRICNSFSIFFFVGGVGAGRGGAGALLLVFVSFLSCSLYLSMYLFIYLSVSISCISFFYLFTLANCLGIYIHY